MEKNTGRAAGTDLGYFLIPSAQPCQAFVWSLGAIHCAAAQASREEGTLAPAGAAAIMAAAREVMQGYWHNLFVIDPGAAGPGQYQHLAGEIITSRAVRLLDDAEAHFPEVAPIRLEDPNPEAPTTLEVNSTALRLGCLKGTQELMRATIQAASALGNRANRRSDPAMDGVESAGDGLTLEVRGRLRDCTFPLMHSVDQLRSAAVPLHYLPLQKRRSRIVSADYEAHLVRHLAEVSGLELSLSDHTPQSMQAIAQVDAFENALRTVLNSLQQAAEEAGRLGEAGGEDLHGLHAAVPASLEMVTRRLKACHLTIVLAEEGGPAQLEGLMPVAALLLFEAVQGLTEAARALAGEMKAGEPALPGFPAAAGLPVEPVFSPIPLTAKIGSRQ